MTRREPHLLSAALLPPFIGGLNLSYKGGKTLCQPCFRLGVSGIPHHLRKCYIDGARHPGCGTPAHTEIDGVTHPREVQVTSTRNPQPGPQTQAGEHGGGGIAAQARPGRPGRTARPR